jgi:hypothetical protein
MDHYPRHEPFEVILGQITSNSSEFVQEWNGGIAALTCARSQVSIRDRVRRGTARPMLGTLWHRAGWWEHQHRLVRRPQ